MPYRRPIPAQRAPPPLADFGRGELATGHFGQYSGCPAERRQTRAWSQWELGKGPTLARKGFGEMSGAACLPPACLLPCLLPYLPTFLPAPCPPYLPTSLSCQNIWEGWARLAPLSSSGLVHRRTFGSRIFSSTLPPPPHGLGQLVRRNMFIVTKYVG